MQIILYVIGKTNIAELQGLISEYQKRLSRFCKFEIIVIKDVKNASSLSKTELLEKEGERFISNFKKDDFIILLDENGEQLSSEKFADKLEDIAMKTKGRIIFVIGGAYGFSEEVYTTSNYKLSMSKMTFNHQMARAIFCEQLYRAFTIINKMPYHH